MIHIEKTQQFAVLSKNDCGQVYYTENDKYECGVSYCQDCCTRKPYVHDCYMSVLKKTNTQSDAFPKTAFIFYDFETMQEKSVKGGKEKIHEPNLCVAQQVCEKCLHGDSGTRCEFCGGGVNVEFHYDVVENFMNFSLDEFKKRPKNIKNVICMAHNEKSFDSQFLLVHMVEKRFIQPQLISDGSKIMMMSVGQKVKFLGSLNYLNMSLSKLPAANGFEDILLKGTFPHLFNTQENQNHCGLIPEKHFYSPDTMSSEDRDKFLNWHEALISRNDVFDFEKEIVSYCTNNVDILLKRALLLAEIALKSVIRVHLLRQLQ